MDFKNRVIQEGQSLPLVVEPGDEERPPTSELVILISKYQEWLEEKVLQHGGVLLRGFAVQDPKDFELVARALLSNLQPYVEGQSPRTSVGGNIYTSTEYPAQYKITLHSELSYAKEPPRKILFYCHTAATVGGETPIVDCRIAYQMMDPELRTKFELKGINYVKYMHGNALGGNALGMGKSWMDHFETSDKAWIENYLGANDIAFEWGVDGSLRTSAVRPAMRKHPVTGETVWYNQANLWHISNFEARHRKQLMKRYGEAKLPTHAYFGDGTPITDEELDRVRAVLWAAAVIFPWQDGDVLVLDNILAAHGRMPFEGPRRILVAMG